MIFRCLAMAALLALAMGCGKIGESEKTDEEVARVFGESGEDFEKRRLAQEAAMTAAEAKRRADEDAYYAGELAKSAINDVERLANADPSGPAADLDRPAGALRPGCQSPGLLVGNWISADGKLRYEFATSGRMKIEGSAIGAASGQYCVIGPGRAQLQGDGGTSVMEYSVSTDGNTFTSTNILGEEVSHRRVR